MRILLFDDSTPIQKVIKLGLRNRPRTELRVSESIEDARAVVREFQPDLIIGSETVAGQRCGTVYQQLLGDRNRVIILAHDHDGEIRLAREGYVNILRKPFQLGELRKLLDQFAPKEHTEASPNRPAPGRTERQADYEELPARAGAAEFSEEFGEEDTAHLRVDFEHQVTELESAFRDTLRLISSSTPNSENESDAPQAHAPVQTQNLSASDAEMGFPTLTMDLSRLEEALKESAPAPTPEKKAVTELSPLSQSQPSAPAQPTAHPVAQDAADSLARPADQAHTKPIAPALPSKVGPAPAQAPQALEALPAQQPPASITRADPDFINQLEDIVVHRTPTREQDIATHLKGHSPLDADLGMRHGPATSAPAPSLTHSQRLALDESIHQILDSRLAHEFQSFEMRAHTRFLTDLENRIFAQLEHRVSPAVEKYLNTHWQALVRSVTAQTRKAVDLDTTQKIETQMHGLQKRLALDLKAELRGEIKDALQNWMGHYSRDILKEVAREELQRLIESV